MWLNLYGSEAGRHKLKNGLKTQKMHFFPVFELNSDSLMTIWVESHQCPSHQSIVLTQGPIHEIFMKNIENWWSWKMTFCFAFSVFGYWVFQKYLFLFFITEKTKGFHMR